MGFSFKSVGHLFSSVYHDLVIGFKATEKFVIEHRTEINEDIETVGGLAALIPGLGPTAVALTRAGEAAFGVLAEGIIKLDKDLTAAAASGGPQAPVTFVVTLEHDLAAEFQLLVNAIHGTITVPPSLKPA